MKNLSLPKLSNIPEEVAEKLTWKVAFDYDNTACLAVVKSYKGFGEYEIENVIDLNTLRPIENGPKSIKSSKIFMTIDPLQYAENHDED